MELEVKGRGLEVRGRRLWVHSEGLWAAGSTPAGNEGSDILHWDRRIAD